MPLFAAQSSNLEGSPLQRTVVDRFSLSNILMASNRLGGRSPHIFGQSEKNACWNEHQPYSKPLLSVWNTSQHKQHAIGQAFSLRQTCLLNMWRFAVQKKRFTSLGYSLHISPKI